MLIELYKDPEFLRLEITYAWYSIAINLVISIALIGVSCFAIGTLKSQFAKKFDEEIKSIRIIFYSFTICFLLRTAYETYENVRNMQQTL
jgi:hypothetical protein